MGRRKARYNTTASNALYFAPKPPVRTPDDGADVVTALHHASTELDAAACAHYLAEGCNVNARSPGARETALVWAVRSRDGKDESVWGVVQLLLAAGADPNIPADNGRTPLFYACERGLALTIETLLVGGAAGDRRDKSGFLPGDLLDSFLRLDKMAVRRVAAGRRRLLDKLAGGGQLPRGGGNG